MSSELDLKELRRLAMDASSNKTLLLPVSIANVVLALLDRLEVAEACAAKVPEYVGQMIAAERRLQQAKEWLDSKQVHAELSCSSWTRLRAILGDEDRHA